ncbi:hypothetical protein GCM10010423_10550 [Streptomyces levis]|uniref:Uncharacterized protein n=1 Tax=Streptomyces levis TaxID=285566 RepID=A0ABP6APJ6_9ACTN
MCRPGASVNSAWRLMSGWSRATGVARSRSIQAIASASGSGRPVRSKCGSRAGVSGQYSRYGSPRSSVRKREHRVSVSASVRRRASVSTAWSSGPSISRQEPVL